MPQPLVDVDVSVAQVAAFVAGAQQDPARHVVYLGVDPATVETELREVAELEARTVVELDDGHVVGAVVADLDAEMRRVWWLGPWADDVDTATALVDAAAAGIAGRFEQEEFAPDARNTMVPAVASARGCSPGPGSAVLVLATTAAVVPTPAAAGTTIRVAQADDRVGDQLAALHDQLFPDTHTPGARLLRKQGTHVLVAEGGEGPDRLRGYVAWNLDADGSGYVDYLGVATDARGAGLGRALVSHAVAAMSEAGADRAHLTVREANRTARRLYTSLGFDEQRIIHPFIRGFTMA